MRNMMITMLLLLCTVPVWALTIGNTDQDVRAIADPVLENILAGMAANDYAQYARDFDATMKEALPESKFAAINQQLKTQFGNCVSREYLGFLNKGQMTLILWKGRFEKMTDDILIKLVLTKRDAQYLVTGLWFE